MTNIHNIILNQFGLTIEYFRKMGYDDWVIISIRNQILNNLPLQKEKNTILKRDNYLFIGLKNNRAYLTGYPNIEDIIYIKKFIKEKELQINEFIINNYSRAVLENFFETQLVEHNPYYHEQSNWRHYYVPAQGLKDKINKAIKAFEEKNNTILITKDNYSEILEKFQEEYNQEIYKKLVEQIIDFITPKMTEFIRKPGSFFDQNIDNIGLIFNKETQEIEFKIEKNWYKKKSSNRNQKNERSIQIRKVNNGQTEAHQITINIFTTDYHWYLHTKKEYRLRGFASLATTFELDNWPKNEMYEWTVVECNIASQKVIEKFTDYYETFMKINLDKLKSDNEINQS